MKNLFNYILLILIVGAAILIVLFTRHSIYLNNSNNYVEFDSNISFPKGYSARYAISYYSGSLLGVNAVECGYIVYKGNCSDRISIEIDRKIHEDTSFLTISSFDQHYDNARIELDHKDSICVEKTINGKLNLYIGYKAKKYQDYNSTILEINKVLEFGNKVYIDSKKKKIPEKQPIEEINKQSWQGK